MRGAGGRVSGPSLTEPYDDSKNIKLTPYSCPLLFPFVMSFLCPLSYVPFPHYHVITMSLSYRCTIIVLLTLIVVIYNAAVTHSSPCHLSSSYPVHPAHSYTVIAFNCIAITRLPAISPALTTTLNHYTTLVTSQCPK